MSYPPMTACEWLTATWAEWCPTVSRGRFEVGPLKLMTRGAVQDVLWSGIEMGRRGEAEGWHGERPDPKPRRRSPILVTTRRRSEAAHDKTLRLGMELAERGIRPPYLDEQGRPQGRHLRSV